MKTNTILKAADLLATRTSVRAGRGGERRSGAKRREPARLARDHEGGHEVEARFYRIWRQRGAPGG